MNGFVKMSGFFGKVKHTDIAIRIVGLHCNTAMGTHMPYEITVLPATRQS